MALNNSEGTPNLLKGVEQTLGSPLFQRITSCKILLVGSGGIGCELLKNLALSGFNHVEVIDLDTIDVSNLNRQFLFRRTHVGQPKCTVACEAALSMVPAANKKTAKYLAHHGNVCDNTRFNVQYIKQFDLVLNALDNIAARRRVNRICLAASVPLVEAGTTGYDGQVTVIDKASNTECYECKAKPTQKVYPICTIRSTPSMPVHTIVWAKELYKLCFGPKVEDSMLFEDQSEEDSEKSIYMDLVLQLRSLIHEKKSSIGLREVVGKVLIALYNTEIQKQLDMDRFKTAKKIPTPVAVSMIEKVLNNKDMVAPSKKDGYKQTKVLSMEECIEEAVSCLEDGAEIVRSGKSILPEFDKDDALAMRLVTCASNLRSYVFGIDPIQSYFSAKGIAGNIIAAIATTNAIVAGLQVLQAFHILRKQMENKRDEIKKVCRYTYCRRLMDRRGFYLLPTTLPDPNPDCFVCRNAVIHVSLDTSKWTLQMLLRRIIKKELGFMEPTILINDDVIHEEGEGADESGYVVNLPKTLVNLPAGGIKHGTMISVEDFTQDLEVELCISHRSDWKDKKGENGNNDVDEEEKFQVSGNKPVVENNKTKEIDTDKVSKKLEDDDCEIEIVSNTTNQHDKKRALEIQDLEEEVEGAKKKLKTV